MSLIKCPNCGEKISDSAKFCVHCKCDLKNFHPQEEIQIQTNSSNGEKSEIGRNEQNTASKKAFASLSQDDQSQLRDEFHAQNEHYEKIFVQLKNTLIVTYCFCFALICTAISTGVMRLFDLKIDMTDVAPLYLGLLAIPAVILFVIFAITALVLLCLRRKTTRLDIVYIVEFDRWLQENKQIEMRYVFSKREKKIYDKLYNK